MLYGFRVLYLWFHEVLQGFCVQGFYKVSCTGMGFPEQVRYPSCFENNGVRASYEHFTVPVLQFCWLWNLGLCVSVGLPFG